MNHPLYVAFIWHQHQPLYKSSQYMSGVMGKYRLPWVRLHGTKDYLDLVLILQRYPNLHQTVNLVPSLILQLEDYAQGKAIDPYLELALMPVEKLNREQKQFIIEHFFDGNYQTLIAPHPRYSQLYQQREDKGKLWCLKNWGNQDYSDLLAWHNLSWIDPLFWDDPEITTWLKQGKNFTLSDRQRIYSKQRKIIAQIIPQHRKMQEIGQLEVITTPYTHPILPLLADTNSGIVALPEITLPQYRFSWEEDIPRHLHKASIVYFNRFAKKPRGLWPSEQSVSPAILPYIAKVGFEWISSDEAVLALSLNQVFHRNEAGILSQPELLYRPYRLETPHGDLAIVFRDHHLSDLIGFTYGSMNPRQAALDLVKRLDGIADSFKKEQYQGKTSLEEPWLVTIALDGENCWEYYQQDGLPFLECLYQQLSDSEHIKLVTVSEFLDKFPPKVTLPAEKLHSGSWVDGSFSTWIGDPVKNKAWDLLTQAREVLAQHPESTEKTNPHVWEALYAAEGSDWFWWFGKGHSSNQDAMFDKLFREHLYAIYQALNEVPPQDIFEPVQDSNLISVDSNPQGFIHPQINGSKDRHNWEDGGRIEIGGSRGTMHRSSAVQRLFYGWNDGNFYLRLEFKVGVRVERDLPNELHLFWYYPGKILYNSKIHLLDLPDESPLNYLFHHHLGMNLSTDSIWFQEAGENDTWYEKQTNAILACDRSLELAVPWEDLGMKSGYSIHVIAILANDGKFSASFPEKDLIIYQHP